LKATRFLKVARSRYRGETLLVQQIAKEQGKITLFTGPATTRLTNEDCSPTGFHWAFDTYSQAGFVLLRLVSLDSTYSRKPNIVGSRAPSAKVLNANF
jgi:hypothetical protein